MMAEKDFKRKLTAILSADAVGYSRLMGENESASVQTITSYRNVISTLIKQHNGIVIDSPGANLLAEFVSVVDAVQCAGEVSRDAPCPSQDPLRHGARALCRLRSILSRHWRSDICTDSGLQRIPRHTRRRLAAN